jgi:hypothetical protein
MLSVSALICSGHAGRQPCEWARLPRPRSAFSEGPKRNLPPCGSAFWALDLFWETETRRAVEADDRGAAGRRRSPEAVPEESWERRSAWKLATQPGTQQRPGTRRPSMLRSRIAVDRSSEQSATFWRSRGVRVVVPERTQDWDQRSSRGSADAISRLNRDHSGDQIPA